MRCTYSVKLVAMPMHSTNTPVASGSKVPVWPIRVPQFQEKYPNIKVQPDLWGGDIQETTTGYCYLALIRQDDDPDPELLRSEDRS